MNRSPNFLRHVGALAATAAFALLPMHASHAADAHFAQGGVAIEGYDTVAFHTAGQPTPGSAALNAGEAPAS